MRIACKNSVNNKFDNCLPQQLHVRPLCNLTWNKDKRLVKNDKANQNRAQDIENRTQNCVAWVTNTTFNDVRSEFQEKLKESKETENVYNYGLLRVIEGDSPTVHKRLGVCKVRIEKREGMRGAVGETLRLLTDSYTALVARQKLHRRKIWNILPSQQS